MKKAATEGGDNRFYYVSLGHLLEPLPHELWMTSLEDDEKEMEKFLSPLSLSKTQSHTHAPQDNGFK